MTLQLYLYRIQKRADSDTHVYTFFSPHDVRHANSLVIVLEGARQKVPDALKKMKEQVSSVKNKWKQAWTSLYVFDTLKRGWGGGWFFKFQLRIVMRITWLLLTYIRQMYSLQHCNNIIHVISVIV